MTYDLKNAHRHSYENQLEIEASRLCVCFYCCRQFPSSSVLNWCDNENTALCPNCGIDAVIGDASGLPVTEQAVIQKINKRWF